MLQYQTIEPGTLQLLKSLQSMPMFQDLRLVGGTALALQLGHRKSIDLDFFGTIEADSLEIREALEESHVVSIVKESKNIHIYMIDGVKVDIVNYRYTWIDEPVATETGGILGMMLKHRFARLSFNSDYQYFLKLDEDAEHGPFPWAFGAFS